jgi:hypothetical protein
MPAVLYKCPIMRQHVSAWVADDAGATENDHIAEAVACAACSRIHMVNVKTGRVIGADDD